MPPSSMTLITFGRALSHHTVWKDGISDRNIGELLQAITKLGYHVTLYTISNPQFFAES
jgi:hypothetical protein